MGVAEACRTVKGLNAAGSIATIDVLGEEISTPEAALEIVGAYHDVFEAIESEHSRLERQRQADRARPDARLRPLQRNLQPSCAMRPRAGDFVRIDMEDSSCTSNILRM